MDSRGSSLGQGPVTCRDFVLDALRDKGYADFNVFKVEYRLELVFVNETPLHIGTGRAESLGQSVDLTVVRGSYYDPASRRLYEGPLIPGSSLKGVMRSFAESLAASKGLLEPSAVELPATEGVLRALCTADYMPTLESWLSGRCSEERLNAASRYMNTCFASPVVGIFGSPWLASHVEVVDAVPVDLSPPPVRSVTRVSIDRLLGSQKPGLLYTMEFVEAGVRWRSTLVVRNIDLSGEDERAVLLRELLRYWASYGISVGGRTSVGHGRLRLLVGEGSIREIRLSESGFVEKSHALSELVRV